MLDFAIDFDGTCVTHEYPNIGKDIGAVPVLKRLLENNHRLILHTMRSDKYLDEAIEWFKKNNIDLYAINENPTQIFWTNSKKIFANFYIDDTALGVPLVFDKSISHRPFVDWKQIENILEKYNLI